MGEWVGVCGCSVGGWVGVWGCSVGGWVGGCLGLLCGWVGVWGVAFGRRGGFTARLAFDVRESYLGRGGFFGL